MLHVRVNVAVSSGAELVDHILEGYSHGEEAEECSHCLRGGHGNRSVGFLVDILWLWWLVEGENVRRAW